MGDAMSDTIAFDVYGTLIDPLGIAEALVGAVGERAGEAALLWREKQIEYLFRRALMRDYRDFPVCTRQALDYTCERLRLDVSDDDKEMLLSKYLQLPPYPDVQAALREIRNRGCRMYAFSNGAPADLAALLSHAGLDEHLDGIVSVHDVRSFKPDPQVYRHFLETAGSQAGGTWLVSGNPFDVIGAHACGWRTAWLRRDPGAVFDPWDVEPTAIIGAMGELSAALS